MIQQNREAEQLLSDEEMQKYLENELSKSPPPLMSNEEAWAEIMKQAQKRKPQKKKFIRKPLMAVASIVGLFCLLSIPTGGSAFFNITDLYYKIQGSVVNVFMGSSSPTSDDPDAPTDDGIYFIEGGSEITIEEMTFQEAQQLTPFRLQQPTYVPDHFEFQTARVFLDYLDEIIEVIQIYEANNGKGFTISQQSFSNDFGLGMVFNSNSAHEDIEINGEKALLVNHEGHYLMDLSIMRHTNYFHIHGNLTKEEIITIAQSLR